METKLIEWFDDHYYKLTHEKEGQEVTDYIPSVTTKLNVIAKPFLAKWRGDIGNREADLRMNEASERGIRKHNAWCVLTTGGRVFYQPWNKPNYNAGEISEAMDACGGNIAILQDQAEMVDVWKLQQWWEIVQPKHVASEMIVYSLENRDAGTVDNLLYIQPKEGEEKCIYKVNGSKPLELPKGLYVVDLKTGNSVDENAFWQTACYAKCVEEMGYGEVVGTLILHTQAKTRTAIEGLATLYHNKEQMAEDYESYRLASALWEKKNANSKPKVFEFPTMLTLQAKKG